VTGTSSPVVGMPPKIASCGVNGPLVCCLVRPGIPSIVVLPDGATSGKAVALAVLEDALDVEDAEFAAGTGVDGPVAAVTVMISGASDIVTI